MKSILWSWCSLPQQEDSKGHANWIGKKVKGFMQWTNKGTFIIYDHLLLMGVQRNWFVFRPIGKRSEGAYSLLYEISRGIIIDYYAMNEWGNIHNLHSQCVTNIQVSQAFSSWSNVGRLRFDQHLVKWLTFDQPMTLGDLDLDYVLTNKWLRFD